jgi:formate C-acetyltransferase
VVYATDAYVAINREQLAQRFHRGDPKLARTLFTRDCVKRRRSFEAGGARYNWAVVSYQGIAHVIDSLAVIRRCVYAEKQVGWTELMAALAADFKGHGRLYKLLAVTPRFGNDVTEVDDLGRDVMQFVWEQLYSHATPRGGRYLASCILFTTYAGAGKSVGALPDGRHAFVPLSDSIGAAAGRDTRGPTALLNSVTKLPLWLAVGTPVLNVRLSRKLMTTPTGLSQAAALVRGFFAKGGLQFQISVISHADMVAARKDPQNHKNLIVRIGGYSEHFVNLSGDLQDSVIARVEHEL